MNESRLQVAVWFLLPIVGILLLVIVLAGRGGLFVLVPTAALLAIVAVIAVLLTRRGR